MWAMTRLAPSAQLTNSRLTDHYRVLGEDVLAGCVVAIRAVDSNCRTVLDADQAIDKPTAQAATKQSSSKNDMAFLMLFFRMVRPSQSVVSSDDTTIPYVFGSGAAFLAKVSARIGLPVNDTRTLNGDITLDNRSFGNRSFLQAGGTRATQRR